MSEAPKDDLWMGMVKVGEKGQIVIPKPAREMFGITPGQTLLLMADQRRGIALVRADTYRELIEQTLSGVPYEPDGGLARGAEKGNQDHGCKHG